MNFSGPIDAESEEASRKTTTIRFILAISIPMWIAVGTVTAIMVWLGSLNTGLYAPDDGAFAFTILVVAVFFYFRIIKSVLTEMRSNNPGSSAQSQLAIDLLRQEISRLNEKVDAIHKALEE